MELYFVECDTAWANVFIQKCREEGLLEGLDRCSDILTGSGPLYSSEMIFPFSFRTALWCPRI